MNAQEIKHLLEKHSLDPKKSLGQNFLIDKNISEKIIQAGEISKTDTVIEVGSGVGSLTVPLSQKAKKVITIEKDEKMIPPLKEVLKEINNIEIINKDVLLFTPQIKNYKLIANIPYYITSPIIKKFLTETRRPSLIILTIQKEVAQRMCARPPKMNLLAIATQFYGNPKIVSRVSRNSFWPIPKVDSSIIRIEPKKERNTTPEFEKKLFNVIRKGFSSPRKQLFKNLSSFSAIKSLKNKKLKETDLSKRAENLSIKEWIELTKNITKNE